MTELNLIFRRVSELPELSPGVLSWRSGLMAILFGLVALGLFTRGNEFSSAYHPDEASKARQVISGEYNFHHPMLMLTLASGAATVVGAGDDVEATTRAGRWVSATLAAGAVVALVLVACLLAGPAAGLIAGLFLVTNHQIFELAHYFKEDPAVLFGVSVFFLSLLWFDRRPGFGSVAWLGVATGLAISGKYVGAVVAPIALILIYIHRRDVGLLRGCFVWAAASVAVFGFVNVPIVLNFAGFAGGFGRELEFAVSGHKGITREVPHGVYGAVFRESTNPVLWILMAAYAVGLLLRWPRASGSERAFAWFPICFALLLSFSPKTHHRYFLPATGCLLVFAAVGCCQLGAWVRGWIGEQGIRAGRWTVGGTAAIALAVQVPIFWAYFDGFNNDARSRLADYIRDHLPADAVIVQDKRVALQAHDLPNPIEGKLFAADVGTFEELRARGIEWVAVAEGDYGRFFRSKLEPTDEGAADFERRKAFYKMVFDEGDEVFESLPGRLQYLQPRIRLIRIGKNVDPT